MAFEPKRLTHPSGKLEDVIAENAIDYSNFLYRDGYVVSDDQDGLEGDAELGTVGGEVDSTPATTEPPKTETASERRKREREEAQASKDAKGEATDAQGDTVPTA